MPRKRKNLLTNQLEKSFNERVLFVENKMTVKGYRAYKRVFVYWLTTYYPTIGVQDFGVAHVKEFLIYLKEEHKAHNMTKKGVSNKTRNLYRMFFSGIWKEMILEKITDNNPWIQVRKLKESKPRTHTIFTDEEREKLTKAMEHTDKELLFACKLIFYCFLRPKEVRGLQVKHFELSEQRIHVPVSIAKIDSSQYVSIPNAFKSDVIDYLKDAKSPNDFVFGRGGGMGDTPIGRNTLYRRFKKYLERLNIPAEKTFYSWKHTGNVCAYRTGKIPLMYLTAQNRHASQHTTENYLRDLGVFVHKGVKENFPSM